MKNDKIDFSEERLELDQFKKAYTRIEKQLLENAVNLTSFVDNPFILVAILQDGKLIYVNDTACQKTGYTSDEAITEKFDLFENVFPDRYIEKMKNRYVTRISDEEIEPYRTEIKRKDGSEFPVIVYGEKVSIRSKPAVVYMLIDVSELSDAQKALENSEANLRDLIDTAGIAIAIEDEHGNLMYSNNNIAKIFGYSLDEFQKNPLLSVVARDDIKNVKKSRKQLLNSEEMRIKYEFKGISKDGSIRYLEADSSKILLNDKMIGMKTLFWDITERKINEHILRENEEKYRILFERAHDAVLIWDVDNEEMLAVNNAAQDLFMCEKEDLLLKNIMEINSRRKKEFEKYVNTLLINGNIDIPEFEIENSEGEKVIVFISANLMDLHGKKVAQFIIKDITHVKNLEEQILRQQRMDSLGTLAGGIAHDFNNILVGIMGYLELLGMESSGYSDSQKQYLQNAEISCDRAAELIKKFRTFSNTTVSDPVTVDLYDAVADTFSAMYKSTNKLLSTKISFKKGLYLVDANPMDLQQVFLNLVTNSIKALDEKGLDKNSSLEVLVNECEFDENNKYGLTMGAYHHIEFSDNGKGMSVEVIKKAFDPFFTTREKSGARGQGLGLSIVFNIVTRICRGHIEIESSPEEGTTISIYLPKTEKHVQEKRKKKMTGIKDGTGTILVVDDELLVRKFMETSLSRFGYDVMLAKDGRSALNIFHDHYKDIDIVLLDLSMPNMSGNTVMGKMFEIYPDVKIVVCSGHSDDTVNESLTNKPNAFLSKPCKVEQLIEIVTDTLAS